MLWYLTFFLFPQQWFSTISLKGGSQNQTYNFVRESHKTFIISQLTRFVLLH